MNSHATIHIQAPIEAVYRIYGKNSMGYYLDCSKTIESIYDFLNHIAFLVGTSFRHWGSVCFFQKVAIHVAVVLLVEIPIQSPTSI